MKTLILTAALMAANILSFASVKSADESLAKQLRKAYYNNKSLVWTEKEQYSQATFQFNSKAVSVFKGESNELIGFSLEMKTTDLPAEALQRIATKFSQWNVIDAITFIDSYGNMSYYATAVRNNHKLILRVTLSGKVGIFAKG